MKKNAGKQYHMVKISTAIWIEPDLVVVFLMVVSKREINVLSTAPDSIFVVRGKFKELSAKRVCEWLQTVFSVKRQLEEQNVYEVFEYETISGIELRRYK